MSNYCLWNPQLISHTPPVIELFLTYGELAYIGDGTALLVRGLLRELGIGERPVRWSLDRYRAFYFTSYPGPKEEWRDRWPPAWRVRVELPNVPSELPSPTIGWMGTEAFDESWTPERDPRRVARARCLVVADFADERVCRSARRAVERAARMADISRAVACGRFPQLRIDLGERDGEFYEAGAVEAVELMRVCEGEGGTIHFSDTTASFSLAHAVR